MQLRKAGLDGLKLADERPLVVIRRRKTVLPQSRTLGRHAPGRRDALRGRELDGPVGLRMVQEGLIAGWRARTLEVRLALPVRRQRKTLGARQLPSAYP